MKISKTELKTALEIVKPGLAAKEIIDQSKSFAFIDGYVITYNDEISVKHPINLNITGAVQSDELYAFLNKVNTDEIDVTVTDTELTIKAGRANSGFQFMSEVSLPIEETEIKGKLKSLPEDFMSTVKFVSMAASGDNLRPVLTYIHINSNGNIEATDSYRLLRYTGTEFPFNTFLIQNSAISTIAKIKPNKINVCEDWVHFKNTETGTIVSCRTLNEQFPNMGVVFEKSAAASKKSVFVNIPVVLPEIIDRAVIFAKRKTQLEEMIMLQFTNKKLTITASSEGSWFKETVPVKYEGDAFEFNISPYLLKDIVGKTDKFEINMEQFFVQFHGESWTYLASMKR